MTKEEFILENNPYYQLSTYKLKDKYNLGFWDISESIVELSYLTHDYFRYYGKFPSKIGKNIIQDLLNSNSIDINKDFIFDNYEGSGTSLVESKIAGFDSIGTDISPFAILASRVKTYNLDTDTLINIWEQLRTRISIYINYYKNNSDLMNDIDQRIIEKIDTVKKDAYIEFKDITKWFNTNVITDLSVIKTLLLELDLDRNREFFSLAFFAIIRRVSTAHDAEVRPHVNKKKKQRDVLEAYFKKVNEMISTMKEWNIATDSSVYSDSFLCSNFNEEQINRIVTDTKEKLNKNLGLVISHPPYLNCFDYIPVYKLKFQWAVGFEEIYGKMDLSQIKKGEIKSYPANNDKLINQYFENNKKNYEIVYNNLRKDGYCCIIIGDCTVRTKLFSVHKGFIKMLENIGFTVDKIVYRSTNYATGKYAYDFRADYHEDEDGKKDAIIFFKK